ncbi:F1-ATP synthase assembly protein, partial [Teratosphaeria nubilosa]
MEFQLGRVVRQSTSSLSVRSAHRSAAASAVPARCLHTTTSRDATPVAHPTVPGPPPQAPQAAVSYAQDRVARKRQQAELLKKGREAKTNPAKPTSALQKRFWKNVSVKDAEDGLQVLLDTRPVRTASKHVLALPHGKRALATSIALEWDSLVSAQQALKQHYIPMTSLTSRALDIANAEKDGDTSIREGLVKMLMRYLSTDTLLCWAPEKSIHEPEQQGKVPLRQRQREIAEPIIAFLQAHIFPGVDIQPILDSASIVPKPQPEMTREVIRGWVTGLPAFELAALERAVLATKSLLIAARLLVEWSQEFRHLHGGGNSGENFGIDEAAKAASMEVLYQIEQWGEVEDTHDVNREDLRRQLGSAVLLV